MEECACVQSLDMLANVFNRKLGSHSMCLRACAQVKAGKTASESLTVMIAKWGSYFLLYVYMA